MNNIERTLLGIGKCNYRHTQCQHIQNEIIRYNSKGIGFSNEFLLKYIDYLKYNDRWYGTYCCLSSGYYCKALNLLFEYFAINFFMTGSLLEISLQASCHQLGSNFFIFIKIFLF